MTPPTVALRLAHMNSRTAPWTWDRRHIEAELRRRGIDRRTLAARWGCSETTVRRVLGAAPNTMAGVDLEPRRREVAALIGVPYEDCEWDEDADAEPPGLAAQGVA